MTVSASGSSFIPTQRLGPGTHRGGCLERRGQDEPCRRHDRASTSMNSSRLSNACGRARPSTSAASTSASRATRRTQGRFSSRGPPSSTPPHPRAAIPSWPSIVTRRSSATTKEECDEQEAQGAGPRARPRSGDPGARDPHPGVERQGGPADRGVLPGGRGPGGHHQRVG